MDLEITNTSLLAINASLEKTKVQQAQEIRNLRHRTRERSIAPLSTASLLSPLPDEYPWACHGSPCATDDEVDEEVEWDELVRQDKHFAEVVKSVDSLLWRAERALKHSVKSEEERIGGKVLNIFLLSRRALSGIDESGLNTDIPDSSGESEVDDATVDVSEASSTSPEISRHIGSLSSID